VAIGWTILIHMTQLMPNASLERPLFEPDYVEVRKRRIRSHYHAPTWKDCTRELLAQLDRFLAAHAGDPVRARSTTAVTSSCSS